MNFKIKKMKMKIKKKKKMKKKKKKEVEHAPEEIQEIQEESKFSEAAWAAEPAVDPKFFMNVVMKQQLRGNWKVEQLTLEFLGLTKDRLASTTPKAIQSHDEMQQIWLTVLILHWLEGLFQGQKDQWEMIHRKAVAWLMKQGVAYKDYKEEAGKVLGI